MKYILDFDRHHPRRFRIANVVLSEEVTVVEVGYNVVPRALKQITQRDVYILHYITGGKGYFNGCKLEKGSAYLVVPGEPECLEASAEESYETSWIMFRGKKVPELLQLCKLSCKSGVFTFSAGEVCAEVINSALDFMCETNEQEEAALMQSAFYKILSVHMREAKKTVDQTAGIAEKMKSYIDECYHMAISVDDFAKQNNVTRNYLYLLFRRAYGTSPKAYLMNVRIDRAKALLSERKSSLNVSQVAYAVGFEDSLYFSRVFRRRAGISPKVYRLLQNGSAQ